MAICAQSKSVIRITAGSQFVDVFLAGSAETTLVTNGFGEMRSGRIDDNAQEFNLVSNRGRGGLFANQAKVLFVLLVLFTLLAPVSSVNQEDHSTPISDFVQAFVQPYLPYMIVLILVILFAICVFRKVNTVLCKGYNYIFTQCIQPGVGWVTSWGSWIGDSVNGWNQNADEPRTWMQALRDFMAAIQTLWCESVYYPARNYFMPLSYHAPADHTVGFELAAQEHVIVIDQLAAQEHAEDEENPEPASEEEEENSGPEEILGSVIRSRL